MAEIEQILDRLEKIFNAVKMKYVIVGGIAVIHYGHIRTTQDVDLIIENEPSKINQLMGLLKAYDFDVMEDQFKMALRENTHVTIFDNKSFLRLDIKCAIKKNEIEVLNNAISEIIMGIKVRIAPLEYVLIGKLIFMGLIDDVPDGELMEFQDVIDFLTLYHSNKEKIDLISLKNKAKQIGLQNTLERLLSFEI